MPGAGGPIDCDVHAVVASIAALEPHLDDHWREVVATTQFKGPTDSPYPPRLPERRAASLASGHRCCW